MDIKTVYGFILIGAGILFGVAADMLGIDGGIDNIVNSLVAAGLFLFAGKEIYNIKVK